MTPASPRIAFLGTGAQGASVAADFLLAGPDFTFIDKWLAHVEAMRTQGLTVSLPTRALHTPPLTALHLCEVEEVQMTPNAMSTRSSNAS
jgi:2-dehydropantoate 2-reductase